MQGFITAFHPDSERWLHRYLVFPSLLKNSVSDQRSWDGPLLTKCITSEAIPPAIPGSSLFETSPFYHTKFGLSALPMFQTTHIVFMSSGILFIFFWTLDSLGELLLGGFMIDKLKSFSSSKGSEALDKIRFWDVDNSSNEEYFSTKPSYSVLHSGNSVDTT